MAQPAQVKFTLPSGEWVAIDNGAAGVVSTNNVVGANGGSGNWTGNGATSGGFDLTANGAVAQSTNPFGDTGTVLIDDSGNDTVYPDPQVGTVKGNPVSGVQPTYATVTKVLTNPLSATIRYKNPA